MTRSNQQTLPNLLSARAEQQPGRAALRVEDGGELTFAEWERRATAAADGLARAVPAGSRIGLAYTGASWIEFAVAFLAVLKAGLVAVPLSARQPPAVLAELLADCDARLLLHDAGHEPRDTGVPTAVLAEVETDQPGLIAPPAPDAPAQILYTSGTTGRQKGVLADHANLAFGHRPHPRHRLFAHSEHALHAFPIGTNAGQMMMVHTLTAHPTTIALARFDAERFCSAIAEHGVGTVFVVPTMAVDLLRSGAADRHDLSSVQLLSSSADTLPAAVAAELAGVFPKATIVNVYTSTEAVPAQTAMIVDIARPGSVGRPTAAGDLRITDADGAVVAPGEVGQVWLRAPAPQRSYLGDPATNSAVFRQGWTRMGDNGYLDADGYLHLVGRDSDVIKSGGLKVSTSRVEAALLEHPAVVEAAVAGVPHDVLGSTTAAAVVLRLDADPPDLRKHLAGRLAPHEIPTRLRVVDALPRTELGKVARPALRELLATVERAPFTPPRTPTESSLATIWTTVLSRGRNGTRQIGVDDDFFELGGDSLAAAQLAARAAAVFGVEAPPAFAFDRPVLAEQAAWLDAAPRAAVPALPPPAGGLSGVQEHWWRWIHATDPPRQMPSVHVGIRVREPLDLAVLAAALSEVVRRHESLRTRFTGADGTPVVDRPWTVPIEEHAAAEPDVDTIATEVVRAPFDLASGRLLRAAVIRTAPADQVLVIAVHHLVFDGWSAGVLLRELAVLYSAKRAGAPSPLPEPAAQFADLVAWEREQWESSQEYWSKRLDGAPRALPRLPGRRGGVTMCRDDQVVFDVPDALRAGLGTLAAGCGATIPMTLHAGWSATLARWSGATELVMATPVTGRTRPEFETIVGCVFRWVLLRVSFADDPDVATHVARVRDETIAAGSHQFHDFTRLHEQVPYPAYFRFESWGHPAHLPGVDSAEFPVAAGANMAWPLAPGDPDLHPPELLVEEAADGDLRVSVIFNRFAYERADMSELAELYRSTLTGMSNRRSVAWSRVATWPLNS